MIMLSVSHMGIHMIGDSWGWLTAGLGGSEAAYLVFPLS